MPQLYYILGALLACHVLYRLIRRRINARNLPPRYWSWDPFMNIDYLILTATDARRQLPNFVKYGHTYRLSQWRNQMGTIVSCHPENVHAILAGKEWGVGFRAEGMGQMVGSTGFICTDGVEWMKARKTIRPAFTRTNIDNFEVMEGVADRVIANIEAAGGKMDMVPELYNAFMHSSMHFILGLDSTEKGDGRPIDVQTFNKLWQKGLLGMAFRLLFRGYNKLMPQAPYNRVCSQLHSFIDFAIEKRDQSTTHAKKTKSMAAVVTAHAEGRADARSQLMQTFLASQDTTAVLTSSVIHILSSRPDLWAKLREEALAAGPDLLTWDALHNWTSIQNILSETLRIRPVFPQTARIALVDAVLPVGGGPNLDQPVPIPAGTYAIANTWGTHVSQDIYGPDAHEFKPDRWNTIKPSCKEYVPFGVGPRSCLGKDKALAEAAYLIARLVRRFEVVEDRTGEWLPEASFSMKNKTGCKVTFR